jgi:hypothetical protein
MNDEEKEIEEFNKNVEWLRKNVAPDDIYEFAEQALMAADFFIVRLGEWIDLIEESKKDKLLEGWLKNSLVIRILKNANAQGVIDTTMKKIEEI